MLERVCGAIGCGKRHRFSRSTATTQPRHGGFFGWVFDGANAAGSSSGSSSLAPTSVQPTSRPTLPPLRTRRNVIAHQLRAGARALNVNVFVCVWVPVGHYGAMPARSADAVVVVAAGSAAAAVAADGLFSVCALSAAKR